MPALPRLLCAAISPQSSRLRAQQRCQPRPFPGLVPLLPCRADERVDVWSLGCLLVYCLCGESPFERAAGEAGGSLMLAVVK